MFAHLNRQEVGEVEVGENSNVAGYVTEKIANAFMGSTVPIYYGTRDIFKLFNKDAFIYYDVRHPEIRGTIQSPPGNKRHHPEPTRK